MNNTSGIIIHTHLENGNPVCIRSIRPGDAELLRVGIGKMSPRSRYLRFFSGGQSPPDWVIERLVDVDGHDHIAWGAIDSGGEDHPAIGAVHAFRDKEEGGSAEFSVAVLDAYHGLGLGKLLTGTILLDAARHGLTEFTVNILADNGEAKDFTRSLGGRFERTADGVMEFHLDIAAALDCLRAERDPPGIADVFEAFGGQ